MADEGDKTGGYGYQADDGMDHTEGGDTKHSFSFRLL